MLSCSCALDSVAPFQALLSAREEEAENEKASGPGSVSPNTISRGGRGHSVAVTGVTGGAIRRRPALRACFGALTAVTSAYKHSFSTVYERLMHNLSTEPSLLIHGLSTTRAAVETAPIHTRGPRRH